MTKIHSSVSVLLGSSFLLFDEALKFPAAADDDVLSVRHLKRDMVRGKSIGTYRAYATDYEKFL